MNGPERLWDRVGDAVAADSDRDEDMALIRRIGAGDMAAFERLYRLFHPRLSRFLLTVTHRPTIVEEALNDTMMVIWESAGAFRGESRLATWIFAIAYRKAMKALRRQDVPVEPPVLDAVASGDPGPDQMLDRRRSRGHVLRAMAGLSADHRAVIDLTYFHGLGYREIAEVMDCPVDTVKTRMFHARRNLKRLLAGEAEDWLWNG